MALSNNLTTQSIYSPLLLKRMLLGAAIGLIVILSFVLRVKTPHPDWGNLWMIRPLIVNPMAGAIGGLCYHVLDLLRAQRNWSKLWINILSLLIFIFGLWMGIVLGLKGTMWN